MRCADGSCSSWPHCWFRKLFSKEPYLQAHSHNDAVHGRQQPGEELIDGQRKALELGRQQQSCERSKRSCGTVRQQRAARHADQHQRVPGIVNSTLCQCFASPWCLAGTRPLSGAPSIVSCKAVMGDRMFSSEDSPLASIRNQGLHRCGSCHRQCSALSSRRAMSSKIHARFFLCLVTRAGHCCAAEMHISAHADGTRLQPCNFQRQ